MQVFLVGGAVRDELMGKPVHDQDWVVVGSTPEAMTAAGFKPVGASFPVFLHPETHEEYALARTEKKSGKGYKGFVFHCDPSVTLEEDLRRRDLTINAIAKDNTGQYIDPFCGRDDMAHRLLRHVSPAFIEDPVRLLRVARFAARFHEEGFTIAPETMQLMQTMVTNGEVDALVPERVWQEMELALITTSPWIFFECLREAGALAKILPEVNKLWGVPNPPQYHPEIDTGVHTIMVLKAVSKLSTEPATRFAALLHDVGKGLTEEKYWPKHHGHEEKGVALINTICKRLKVPNHYRSLALLVGRYHGTIHRANELKASTMVSLLTSLDAFRNPARFMQALLACEADSRGRTGFESAPYPQATKVLAAYEAIKDLDVRPLVEAGLNGEQIKRQLYEARIDTLKKTGYQNHE